MKANKDKTVEITSKVINVSPSVVGRAYDEQIGVFTEDGVFDPKAVAVLKQSFIEMGLLKEIPDGQGAVHDAVPAGEGRDVDRFGSMARAASDQP